MTTSREVLSLYRQLLHGARKFENYNFREYAKRKIVDSFKSSKGLQDQDAIKTFYNAGIDGLAQLNRLTTVSQMFTFEKLVVEPLKKQHL